MIVQELITKLGFKADTAALSKYNEGIKSLKTNLFAVTAAVTGAVAGVVYLAKSSAEYADNLDETAQKAGISTTALQGLGQIAKEQGSSVEGLASSMKFLGKNLYEAKTGSKEMTEAFRAIKLDPKKLKDPEQAFYALSDALASVSDPIKRHAIEMKLMGKSGTEMDVVMSMGSKAIKEQVNELQALGAIMDEETIKAAGPFADTWSRLTMLLTSLKNVIGAYLAPVLNDLAKQFMAWWKNEKNQKTVKEGLVEFAKQLGNAFVSLAKAMPTILAGITKITDAFGGLGNTLKWVIGIWLSFKGLQIANALGTMAQGAYGLAKALMASGAAMATLGEVAVILVSIKAIYDSIKSLYTGEATGIIKWVMDLTDWLEKAHSTIFKVVKAIYYMSGLGVADWIMDKTGGWEGLAKTIHPEYFKTEQQVRDEMLPKRLRGGENSILNKTKLLPDSPSAGPVAMDNSNTANVTITYQPRIEVTTGEGFDAQLLSDLIDDKGRATVEKMSKDIKNAVSVPPS